MNNIVPPNLGLSKLCIKILLICYVAFSTSACSSCLYKGPIDKNATKLNQEIEEERSNKNNNIDKALHKKFGDPVT